MRFRRNFTLTLVVLLIAPAITWAQNAPLRRLLKADVPDDVQAIRDVNYAGSESNEQTLDLYLPAKSARTATQKPPLVVWIHGGAWKGGSKDRCPITYLTNDGFAVASINYRLTATAPFPAQIHDCKGAIRYLRAQATKHGYDDQRIGVGGSSAGGHLVALLGTSGEVKELEGNVGGNQDHSSRVQAVLNLFGPTDLHMIAKVAPFIVDHEEHPVYKLLGGKPSEKLTLAEQASPVHHVSPDDAPLLMMHGTRDVIVQLAQSKYLHEAYQKAKLPTELIVLEGAGHGGPQFFDDSARQSQKKFFEQHLLAKP